jgi:hypothetical protein
MYLSSDFGDLPFDPRPILGAKFPPAHLFERPARVIVIAGKIAGDVEVVTVLDEVRLM